MGRPSRTGDLAAAVEHSDRKAIEAAAMLGVLIGVAFVALIAVNGLRRARLSERAEWAFWAQQLEGERDVARRARFTAGPDDVVDEEPNA
jgi:hypothetical protein